MGKPIIIVQGGQYGSEAKGLITAKITNTRTINFAVRTGTVNAGHTVYYNGRPYAMQQLPVSWVDPGVQLVLGPGAYVHPEILHREIEWINAAMPERDVRDRLFIDSNCGIHLPSHTDRSSASGRHHRMGATGKGSSEAVIDKIYGRGEVGHPRNFREWLTATKPEWARSLCLYDTAAILNKGYDNGSQVLIEGTQGTLLDLHLGPYPYTTHKQTQAASWMAEAGLSATLPIELVLVMRTYPIRVAGNSGPLPRECSWYQLAGWINDKRRRFHLDPIVDPVTVARFGAGVNSRTGTMGDPAFWSDRDKDTHSKLASEVHRDVITSLSNEDIIELRKLFEFTTVTKKLRRVAQWDWTDATRSVMLNRPTSIALTFMNYEFPEAWGVTRLGFGKLAPVTRDAIYRHVSEVRDRLGVPVSYMGFGPDEDQTIALYGDEVAS